MPQDDELDFLSWFRRHAGNLGLDPNPDHPLHKYDWRGAFLSGAAPDDTGHWPSEFKHDDHPNRFVGGMDTKTGLFAPTAQADAFGPLSKALGDPEATDPYSFGMPGKGSDSFLQSLLTLLKMFGMGGGVAPTPTSPRSFMSEGMSDR